MMRYPASHGTAICQIEIDYRGAEGFSDGRKGVMAPLECTMGLKGLWGAEGGAVASIKFYTLWEGLGRDTDRYTPFLIGSRKLDLKRMAPFLGRFNGFTQRALNQPIKKPSQRKFCSVMLWLRQVDGYHPVHDDTYCSKTEEP